MWQNRDGAVVSRWHLWVGLGLVSDNNFRPSACGEMGHTARKSYGFWTGHAGTQSGVRGRWEGESFAHRLDKPS